MSNVRINALTATAVTPNYDDYFVIDGNTYGTRNILATTALSSITGYGPMSFSGDVTVFGNVSGNEIFDIAGNSVQWNAAYSYANSTSSLNTSDFTAIATTSANWNLAYSDTQAITPLTGNWNQAYTYASTNSAYVLSDIANVASTSANWNQSYTYFTWLTANSGNNTGGTAWQSNSALVLGDITDIASTSANWNLAWTYTTTNSAQLANVEATSGNWNQSYTYFTWLTANSGNNTGGTAWQSNSALVLGDLTNIASTSANWNQAFTYTNNNSGAIQTNFTNIAANSAYWNTASGGNYLALSGGSVTGLATFNNVVVLESLSALSAVYLGTTIMTSYSSLSVIDYGPGPALFVQENSSTGTIAQFNDTYGSVLYVGNRGSTTYNGLIGVNVTNPGAALTVGGTLSTNAVINDVTGTSTQWNAAYSYANTISALEASNFTNIATTSANWNLAYNDVQVITPLTGNWNQAYTYASTNSAYVLSNISNVANTSANWNLAWTYSTSNSAQLANVEVTSASWNTAYTYTINNSAQLANVEATSGNWNQAYTYTNTNSSLFVLSGSDSYLKSLTAVTLSAVNLYAANSYPTILSTVNLSAYSIISSTGIYSTSAFKGTYTDGIIVDYVTGNGRISVGPADNLSFYNGGPATTSLVTISSNGSVGINATPANGQTLTVGGSATFFGGVSASVFWVNGSPLSAVTGGGSGSQALIAGYSIVFGR